MELNDLVIEYKQTKSDDVFAKIYEMITKTWTSLETVAKSLRSDIHEVTALYEDVMLKCIDKYDGQRNFLNFYRSSLIRARADLYRRKKVRNKYEHFEEDLTLFENLCADYEDTTAATVLSKKEADQRQLIDFLLSGADDLTTAIVREVLNDRDLRRKINYTEIARKLNLNHHSVVYRKLEALAKRFDSKKFGDYRDFLVAI